MSLTHLTASNEYNQPLGYRLYKGHHLNTQKQEEQTQETIHTMSGDLEVGQIELNVEENLQLTIQPLNQKAVIRIGSLLIIFSVAGILNPPMTVSSLQH